MTEQLTRERILSMEPGRELDALVAKKIFGVNNPDARWSPSTEISAAWAVVEKSINWGGVEIGYYGNANGKWFVASTYTANTKIGKGVSATAHTATEAICKAALLAVMDG